MKYLCSQCNKVSDWEDMIVCSNCWTDYMIKLIKVFRKRSKTLVDMAQQVRPFLRPLPWDTPIDENQLLHNS